MKRKIYPVLFVLISSLLLLCSCADKAEEKSDYEVRLILRNCEGITIEGDNIVDVKSGRTVTFKVSINEGYVYLGNTADAEYNQESGKLRLSNVIAPKTIDMIVAKESDIIKLSILKNNSGAYAQADDELFAYPTSTTLRAESTGNLEFAGWSEGGYLEEGGTLLSSSPVYNMYVDETKTVYANFTGYSEYEITYHLNDGTDNVLNVNGEFKDIYSMQQTIESNGTFVRDGYTAVGYSTEPALYDDYSSVNEIPGFANMGGVTYVDGKSLDLYVVWAKNTGASDFKYEKAKVSYISDSTYNWGSLKQSKKSCDGIIIKKYTGNETYVVIPEEIDGLPVMTIEGGAFSGDIEKVVIPRSVKNIEKNAFSECENLREVVIFDSVVTVYNESFPQCLKTVVLNAQRKPVYSGAVEGSFCIKYERLRTTKGKKIIVVAGSSSLNGINSPLFEELMPGYSVINYGTNVANPSIFFLDVISNYVGEGDLVIHAPEFFSSSTMGSNSFHAKMFRGNEQCYDIFREVDMSKYTNFWMSFCQFQVGDASDSSLVPAIHQSSKEYQLDTDMNKYGDMAVVRKSVRGSFGNATEVFKYDKLNADNLNSVNKKITENGGTLLMSFATFDKSRLAKSSAVQSEYDKFTNYCADNLDYPVISNVGTYIMEHSDFYDSEWHCNDEGAKKRTRNLCDDLKKYLSNPNDY